MHLWRSVITLFCANILMWYEFSLYIVFSSILSAHFFPNKDAAGSLVNIMLIFAFSFIARPLGTLLLGTIGDRIGRKTSLILSIFLMTVPTLAIGILPTYATWGILAPVLLGLMRLLQSFSTGGEFSGIMTYYYEISPRHLRGLIASLTFCASQLGNVISNLEFFFLSRSTSMTAISSWGWRISFIIGGFIGLLSWVLLRTLHETPLFKTMKTEGKISKKPIREAFSNYKITMMKAFGVSSLTATGWYIVFIYSPFYLFRILKIDSEHQLLINALLILGSSLLMPVFGYLADGPYRRALFICSAIGIMILSIPLYLSSTYASFTAFICIEILMTVLLTIQFALLPSILCELFPPRVRYTCVGISYNFCIVLFGGAAPVAALALTTKTSHLLAPAFILIASAILTLWSYMKIKEEAHLHE